MPKTGGRKKGSLNKRTLMIEHARSGSLPLDYMLQVMRDPDADPYLRAEMAKAAAPYCHARKAPQEARGQNVPVIIYTHPPLEADESDTEVEPK
jgi:hypothetical protein